MLKATSEKRQFRMFGRVPCGAATRVRSAFGAASGTCGDLSLGGMLLRGTALPVGERVELTMELPGSGPVQLFGEVRHNCGNAIASGIRFTHLTQASLALLSAYISAVA